MNSSHPGRGPLQRLAWRILSVPVLVKTLGIGVTVAAVFGIIIILQTRNSLAGSLNELLKNRTLSEAQDLAASLARPLTTNDRVSVEQALQVKKKMFPDISYIIVRDPKGHVLAHTFKGSPPKALIRPPVYRAQPRRRFRVLDSGDQGMIFEAMHPIVKGHAGSVQIGITDQMVRHELRALTGAIMWGMAASMLIGFSLAMFLSLILTQPVHHLKAMAEAIRKGRFATRARVFSGDEIGDLAVSFNQLAQDLETYRAEVEAKERDRLALLGRVVGSQEEERRSISRELHDQFGQSLLAILVDVQTNPDFAALAVPVRKALIGRVLDLIDELRRIARGLRPTILDDYGLDSALGTYVKEVAGHFNLEIDYRYSHRQNPQRLPEHVEVTLYRVAQEAMANVARHSGASNASVVVLEAEKDIMLLVEDNGKGFDLCLLQGERGLGIMGMRERAQLLGGAFDIESTSGVGTTVRVRIPLSIPETHDGDQHPDRG